MCFPMVVYCAQPIIGMQRRDLRSRWCESAPNDTRTVEQSFLAVQECGSGGCDVFIAAGREKPGRDNEALVPEQEAAADMMGISVLPDMMALSPEAMQQDQGMLFDQELMPAPMGNLDAEEFIHMASPAGQSGLQIPNANLPSGSDVEVERCAQLPANFRVEEALLDDHFCECLASWWHHAMSSQSREILECHVSLTTM